MWHFETNDENEKCSLYNFTDRLYNDVIDRVSSYYDILWKVVNVEEINNELLEFQNR